MKYNDVKVPFAILTYEEIEHANDTYCFSCGICEDLDEEHDYFCLYNSSVQSDIFELYSLIVESNQEDAIDFLQYFSNEFQNVLIRRIETMPFFGTRKENLQRIIEINTYLISENIDPIDLDKGLRIN